MGVQVYINKKIDKYFEDLVLDLSKIPFSFVYDEIKYSGFDNKNFKIINHKKELINKKIEHVFDLLFKEQIKISLCLSYYQSHGFYEYTIWFENISNYDSKLFKEFKSEFFVYGENAVLKGILGDHVNKYKPYAIDLSLQKAEFMSQ